MPLSLPPLAGASPETAVTILLVDDDPAILRGVGGLLRDEGYRTAQVDSAAGAAAELAAPREPPALVLLDLRMPGESGLELLVRLPRPLRAPIVVMTGEASIADAVQALKLGALDFVEKPPAPERLLTAVRNALALATLGRARPGVGAPSRPAEGAPGASAPLGDSGYRELVDEFERNLARRALAESGGNVAAAARLLKVDRGNFYRRLKALGIEVGE